ncbi:hypothetical protein FRC09_014409 [Ceratobasidium sp. 395]|nr:hypothetical protein FRC09_014409 [Ceratobasidium sp. 395]
MPIVLPPPSAVAKYPLAAELLKENSGKMKTRSQTVSQRQDPALPSRKRQRQATSKSAKSVTKKRVKGTRGGLEIFLKLPTEVFTQIVEMLNPGDLIVLTRTNKFFRHLLLSRRRATAIWRQSFKNVPDLPGCPPDMCEPQYAALVFSPYCTFCGKLVRRGSVDASSRVCICTPCEQKTQPELELVSAGTVERSMWRLIPQRWEDGELCFLRRDITLVGARMSMLKASGDNSALQLWQSDQAKYVQQKKKHSSDLDNYLISGLNNEWEQRERTRKTRKSEIQSRLRALGWSREDDMHFWYGSKDRKAWDALVDQPKPLTERGWEIMKPKLTTLLENNRRQHSDDRIARRIPDFCKELEKYQSTSTMRRSFRIHPAKIEDKPKAGPDLAAPFPQSVDISRCELIRSLLETEFPLEDTAKLIQERAEEIEQEVLTWQRKSEDHFVGLIQEANSNQVSKSKMLRVSQDNLSHQFSSNAIILMRADSFFRVGSGLAGYAYSYGNAMNIPRSDSQPPSFEFHSKGSKIARALLAEIESPDASFLDFSGIRRFLCGRCGSSTLMSWEEIVNHYLSEEIEWEKKQPLVPIFTQLEIAYNHVHVLTPQNSPLVRLLNATEALAFETNQDRWSKKECLCRLCNRASVKQVNSEGDMVGHIRSVHGIIEPNSTEHFKIKNIAFQLRKTRVPDPGYPVW